MSNYLNLEMRKTVKLDSRERSSEFRKLYEITGVVGVGGGGTVYAGMTVKLIFFFKKNNQGKMWMGFWKNLIFQKIKQF